MSDNPITLTINYRGKAHVLSVLPDSTLADLQNEIKQLTEVPPSLQKLLYKGKRQASSEESISQAGIKDGAKIQLLGSTTKDLEAMKAVENENQRRERIMKERALKAPVKVRTHSHHH